MASRKPKYTHLSQRNQILKRPGQHIGSTKNAVKQVWIAETISDGADDETHDRIVEQEITYNPGLIHIFYEVLGNAQDNYFRSKDSKFPLTKIEVTVDPETGEVSILNDGLWIPAVIHEWDEEEEKIDNRDHYEAEIIFGNLNSSSNYDDEDTKRIGGGLHGVGVKLTNIFSQEFKVEAFDPDNALKFTGVWVENMNTIVKAKVTACKQKKGYTKVTYTADFERFGVKGYSEEHIAVMRKMCIDCAMITGQKVVFNGEKISVKNLGSYVSYYTSGNRVEFKSGDSTVVLCEKDVYESGLSQLSWVNGINTTSGGVHVDEWRKAIFKPLLEKIQSKYSKGKRSTPLRITMKTLEQYFMLFISCNLPNPEFDGQTKSVLSSPKPSTDVPASKITAMMKWGFIDDINETARIQGMKELQKTDGKKTTRVNVPKADDANKAGGVNSKDCILFITEGDSAKAFAVKGISAIEHGTDWYGVLPVRGKVLNVRGASADQINNNKEIAQLKEMLGLRHGTDYTSESEFKTLRYGRIRILTDADKDGDHIKGLIINFFQYFFPSLITRGYVCGLRTPIVKATVGRRVLTFYYLENFKDWASKQTTKFTAKYYKGLGTSKDAEIVEIFEDPRNVQYLHDTKTADTVSLVFDKKRADDRKRWLEDFEETEFVYGEKDGVEQVPISDFFNNEMIGFSIYDNQRSIPSVVDGFKPSQRKALWVGLKVLNEKDEYKIAQFAAEVAKRAEYHHGETSMEQAIVGMAQTFVGANNISFFYEAGQFGTRLAGGKDASAGRYIFTFLNSITRYIFRKEDDPILDYLEDEGKQIEPRFFVPVVPMLLVNGCHGIGTGYSCDVPSFNPKDLVQWIYRWLDNEAGGKEEYDGYPDLQPWYWGFKGETVRDPTNPKKFTHKGIVRETSPDCYVITELPVGVWTSDYKDHLETMTGASATATAKKAGYTAMTVAQLKAELGARNLQVGGTKAALVERLKKSDKDGSGGTRRAVTAAGSGQLIKKWEWHGDAYSVNLKVWTKPGVTITHDTPKFKLQTHESLTNMTAFTPTGGMKKYDELDDILRTFCEVRYDYYKKRKKHLLAVLKAEKAEKASKAHFIKSVLEDFTILKRTEDKLIEHLEAKKYWKKPGADKPYDYLLSMEVRRFTNDKYKKLLSEIKAIGDEIDYITKKTPKQMWKKELEEFLSEYDKWRTATEAVHTKLAKKKIKRKS